MTIRICGRGKRTVVIDNGHTPVSISVWKEKESGHLSVCTHFLEANENPDSIAVVFGIRAYIPENRIKWKNNYVEFSDRDAEEIYKVCSENGLSRKI